MLQEHKEKRLKAKKLTSEKRKSQDCKVFELKLDKSHMSSEKRKYLNLLFLEAKWLYNSSLASEDIFKIDTKLKTVIVLDSKKQPVERRLDTLSSQMRQGIVQRMQNSIKALSVLKKKNKTVGRLKFKSEVNSIPLQQFNTTYRFSSSNHVVFQGFKKQFRIRGMKQIPKDAEFANATLIKSHANYFLKVTCFVSKKEKQETGNCIGLDFGIKDNVVTSNGDKYNFKFPETKSIKTLQDKMSKCKPRTCKHNKLKTKLRKSYYKLSNRKKDAKNKFIHALISQNDLIAIQDESLHSWHSSTNKGFGRRVQHSIMGGIISELKKRPETHVIDKWFSSTKLCPVCGTINKPSLNDRIYHCICGYRNDRDIHSAMNILIESFNQIPTGRRSTMLDCRLKELKKYLKSLCSNQEAPIL